MNSFCTITLVLCVVAAADARPALLGREEEAALVQSPNYQVLGSFDPFLLPASALAEAQHHGPLMPSHDWRSSMNPGLGHEVNTHQITHWHGGLMGESDHGSTDVFETQNFTPAEAIPVLHSTALGSGDAAFPWGSWPGYSAISPSHPSPSFLGQLSGYKRPHDLSFDTIGSSARRAVGSYSHHLDALRDWLDLEHDSTGDTGTYQMGWDGMLEDRTAIAPEKGYQSNSWIGRTCITSPQPVSSVQQTRLTGPQHEFAMAESVEALNRGSQSHTSTSDVLANLSPRSPKGSGAWQGNDQPQLGLNDFTSHWQALVTRLKNPKGTMSESSHSSQTVHWRPLTPPPDLANRGPVTNRQTDHMTLHDPGFTDLGELHPELYSPRVNPEEISPAQAVQPDQETIIGIDRAHPQSAAHEDLVQHANRLEPPPNGSQPPPQLDRSARVTLPGKQSGSGVNLEQEGVMAELMLLSSHSPPIHHVHEGLVRRAMLPFEKKLDWFDLICTKYQKSKKAVCFKDVRARQLFGSKRRGSLTSSIIRILTTKGKYVSVATMSYALQHLLRWIIFNNAAFLWKIEKSEHVGRTGPAILNWLLNEFFRPKNSAPVAGQIESIVLPKEGAFGSVQKILVRFIAASNPPDKACITSISLLQSWYKESPIPGIAIIFTDDITFQRFMFQAVLQAKKSHLALKMPSRDPPPPIDSLDNLKIFDLNDISLPFQPRGLKQRLSRDERPIDGQRSSPVELEIITDIYKLYETYEVSGAYQWDLLKPIPAVLIPQRGLMPGTWYAVRLIDEGGKIIESAEVTRELATLLLTFRHYHQVFIRFLKSEKVEVNSKLQDSLWVWLRKALLGKEGEGEDEPLQPTTVPIFGVVKFTFEGLQNFGFLPVQINLIKLLAIKVTQPDFDQAVISTLGYWYKNECRDFWNTQFSVDYKYWYFMARALDWHFMNR